MKSRQSGLIRNSFMTAIKGTFPSEVSLVINRMFPVLGGGAAWSRPTSENEHAAEKTRLRRNRAFMTDDLVAVGSLCLPKNWGRLLFLGNLDFYTQ